MRTEYQNARRWPRPLHALPVLAGLYAASLPHAWAQIVINELHAAPNERFLQYNDRGEPRVGTGPFWGDAAFQDNAWQEVQTPAGFGFPDLAANFGTQLDGNTPSLYLRRRFTVSSTLLTGAIRQLILTADFNDGFVAFLNGREVARSRTGPKGLFLYADQTALAARSDGDPPEEFVLGNAADLLTTGENVLAVQVHNFSGDAKGNLRFAANLRVQEGEQVTTVLADDFNSTSGARRIHTNTNGAVQNDTAGSPPPGSWLALSPAVESSVGWQQFAALSELSPTSGTGGSGALQFTFTATGNTGNATVRGPVIDLSSVWNHGHITAQDLESLDVSLNYKAPPGFIINPVLETVGDAAPARLPLPSLPPISGGVGADVTGYWRFDESSATNAALITAANSETNPAALLATGSNNARYSTDVPAALIFDPLSGQTRENRYSFNAAAANARIRVPDSPLLNSNSFTVEFFLKLTGEPTDSDPFVRRYTGAGSDSASSSTRRSWLAEFDSSAAAITYGRVRSRWDTPGIPPLDWTRLAGGGLIFADTPAANGDPASYPAGSDPQAAGDGVNDAASRKWHHIALTWNGATKEFQIFTDLQPGARQLLAAPFLHPSAALELGKFSTNTYGLNLDEVKYSARVLKPSEFLRPIVQDSAGFRPWEGSLRSTTPEQQQSFLAALNASFSTRVRLALELRPESVSTAGSVFVIDDIRVTSTRQATQTALISSTDTWRGFPGIGEPSGGVWDAKLPREANNADQQDSLVPFPDLAEFSDWIELHNPGAAPVRLAGWSLTDDAALPQKWSFPAATVIPAGGYLLILADDHSTVTGLDYLHASFKLSEGGETVQLHHNGALVDEVSYPRQDAFHSYGRSSGGPWVYFSGASPGKVNDGPTFTARVKTPAFSLPGGFYNGAQSLSITTETQGTRIRYTTDGTEPTTDNGTDYTAPLTLTALSEKAGRVIRARAFREGWVASGTEAATYLINQHANLRTVPALLFTGDPQHDFYKPFGILSIEGGTVDANSIWSPVSAADYNLPLFHGRAYERPVFVEWHRADGGAGFAQEAGLRVASSPHARPRLKLQQTALSPWVSTSFEKPSFNILFRESYDHSELDYPLLGRDYPVQSFDQFRARAGKNDIVNPFIKDELIRRTFSDMGNLSVRGTFNTLYINGAYKGFYNTVERYRSSFFQSHYRTDADWDILIRDFYEDGDPAAWATMMAALGHDLTLKSNYDTALQTLDADAVIDYFLINIYTAQSDWPNNNWVAARERSDAGRYRLYLWDSEISFAQNAAKPVSFDTIQSDLKNLQGTLPALFRALYASFELRLRMADRINRHFFNGGALDDRAGAASRIGRRKAELAAEVEPLLQYTVGQSVNHAFLDNWMLPATGRRKWLFDNNGGPADISFRKHGLWPVTEPPLFSQHGGVLPQGTNLTISKPAGASATSVIYYTLDGSDPRLFGGTPAPGVLTCNSPVAGLTDGQFTLSARVRNATTGEWSPLTQAIFTQPAVPASAQNVVISQFHYHPGDPSSAERDAGFTDADDFEFVELTVTGADPVSFAGVRFDAGIIFDFQTSPVQIAPAGGKILLVRNRRAFALRYGSQAAAAASGEYSGKLDNAGELLRLTGVDGPDADTLPDVIREFAYGDAAPWPGEPDGHGPSLALRSPELLPDHANPDNWEASSFWGGQPAGTIPVYSFTAWRERNLSGVTPEQAAPNGDADGDGIINLLEFAQGTDPLISDPGKAPAVGIVQNSGDTEVEFAVLVSPQAAGYSLAGEASADLLTWAALPGGPPVTTAPGYIRRAWRLPLQNAPSGWLRLRLTLQP